MPDSLTIELRRVAEAAIERSVRLPAAAALVTGGEFAFVEPPTVSFVAQASASGGIQVRGELDALVRLTCRRCLAEYEEGFVVPLDFRLQPGLEPDAEDEGVFALRPDGDVVDIGSMVREELSLAMPEFPECQAECRGLCPSCGVNLNEATCECGSSEPDPRWETLRKLRV
jgi:uncharacterized protein